MKVSRISSIRNTASVPPSPVVQRLNAVRRGLKKHGAVILQDTKLDHQVIERLRRQFGDNNVKVERSKTIRVSVDGFKR